MIAFIDMIGMMDLVDEYGQGVPFGLKFVTCDSERGTGGEIIDIPAAVKNNIKKGGKIQKALPVDNESKELQIKKAYRNLRICGTPNIRRVHLRLIIEFNGHPVYHN